jgi:hypothetical protein
MHPRSRIPAVEGKDALPPGDPFITGIHIKGGTMPMKRTTHRSVAGTKLYAVRDKKGRFVDIQSYKRAHAADLRRKSKAEKAK